MSAVVPGNSSSNEPGLPTDSHDAHGSNGGWEMKGWERDPMGDGCRRWNRSP